MATPTMEMVQVFHIEDGRYVEVKFEEEGEYVHIVETIEHEEVNGLDLQ
jgi:hypothetical protein